MGLYFCAKCKFFDDEGSKDQFHCDECGICRVGGKENYFHCKKCDCCYEIPLKDAHNCLESATRHDCPVCLEFLFDTTKEVRVLRCGHTIHVHCVENMEKHNQRSCPFCRVQVT